jgi:hypothetical protein
MFRRNRFSRFIGSAAACAPTPSRSSYSPVSLIHWQARIFQQLSSEVIAMSLRLHAFGLSLCGVQLFILLPLFLRGRGLRPDVVSELASEFFSTRRFYL